MDHAEAGSGLPDVEAEDVRYGSNPLKTQRPAQGINSIGFCASPADSSALLKRKNNVENKESLGNMLRHGIVEHQLGITLNLIFLLGLTYACFPDLRQHLRPFFDLQYGLPSGRYLQGPQDAWIVLGFIVLFTGIRAACMDFVLMPATKALGIKKEKMRVRFSEQAYLLFYYIVIWSWGLHLFVVETPELMETTVLGKINGILISLWSDWPRHSLSASMKAYYLLQTAFWVQQILVIHLEERRKDHWQMLAHHIITSGLLIGSYGSRQIRVGNAILVLMDVVDLIFPFAKCLRYLGLQTACDIAFGAFVVTWFFARHVAYLTILYSLTFQVGNVVLKYGTYDLLISARISDATSGSTLDNLFQTLVNSNAQIIQFTPQIRNGFLVLLGGLQVITIIWGAMIVKVVIRVLRGEGADDSRSDDEEDEVDEEITKTKPGVSRRASEQRFIEITADTNDLYYPPQRTSSNGRISITRKKSKGISSGLNLGEHKDILNRIGCLSDEQLAREAERRQESVSPQPGVSRRF